LVTIKCILVILLSESYPPEVIFAHQGGNIMLKEPARKLLQESNMWILATSGDTPNLVPIMFHELDDEDRLVFYQVFMNETVENIKSGSSASVLVMGAPGTMEGYQLRGSATYTTAPDVIAKGNTMSNKFNLATKGAVIVSVEKTIIMTPGLNNGKNL
jgi:hypothetical protein